MTPEGRQEELVLSVTPVFRKTRKAKKPVVVNIGGADSSKSYSTAQLMIAKFLEERNKEFLISRKTLPSLRLTAYKLVLNLLKEYQCYSFLDHNKSNLTFYNPINNNNMVFRGLDDPTKIKSAEFNYIWMEEAAEFTWDDYLMFKLRRRAKTTDGNPNQMYLSLNPVDEFGFINQKLKGDKDVLFIHSTYLDNPFYQEEDARVLEALKGEDNTYYQIYTLGLYAKLKGMIHDLLTINDFPECSETIYCLDFGYVNPSVLMKLDIDIEAMAVYMTELIYETHLTNSDLIDRMKEEIAPGHRRRDLYADSAEPDRIEEIYEAGFNCKPSKKGPKSVVNGINFLNRFTLYSREEYVKINKDFRSYKRKVDKNGNVLEDPVKFRDHAPDASRYGIYTHLWERFVGEEPGEVYHQGTGKPKVMAGEKPEPKEKAEKRKRVAPDVTKVTRGDPPEKKEEPKPKKKEIIEDDDVGFVV